MSEHYWWVPMVVVFGSLGLIVVGLFYKRKFIWGITMGMAVFLLLAIALPSARPARPQAQRNACAANVKQIATAVEEWSKENKMTAGEKIDTPAALKFLKGGKMPVCPRGGFYKLSKVGQPVECSLPEHANSVPVYYP